MNATAELLKRGEHFLAAHALTEAAECFARAEQEQRSAGATSADAAVGLARVHLARHETGAARAALAAVATTFPADPRPLAFLGVAEELEGRLDEAITLYSRALRMDGALAVAHYNLGRALGQLGQWAEAVRALAAATDLEPAHVGYLYALGTALQFAGRTEAALEVFARCLRIDPDFLDGYATLADVLVFAGQDQTADLLLEEATRRLPSAGVLQSKRAAIASRRNDLAGAIRHLQRQTEVAPGDEQAWLSLAAYQTMLLDFAGAARALDRALELNPRSAPGHYHRGAIFDACRLKGPARREFRTSLECDPSFWKPYNNLGASYLEEADASSTAEAVRLLEKSLELAPASHRLVPLFNLALGYWKSGRKAESERCAREAARGPAGDQTTKNARRFLGNFDRS